MDLWQAFVLSLIQGLTEFLPISSSGHLVITRDLLNWPEASVAFDAFTGLGTLSAVLLFPARFNSNFLPLVLAIPRPQGPRS